MLRQKCISLLRRFLSRSIRKYRMQHQLTQEQLSELLYMAPRSYADLEHGTCGCSALTLIRFLLLLKDEEVLRLLHEIGQVLEEAERHDVA